MDWMLLPLKRYADFSGRSRRTEFWMWILFQFLISIVFVFLFMFLVGGAMLTAATDPTAMMAFGGIGLILYLICALIGLAFFIPSLAVTVRRLHDTNRSGWWIMLFWGPYLLMLVSPFIFMSSAAAGGDGAAGGAMMLVATLAWFVGGITLLVFMFLEGTRGPNKYGADPKGQDTGQVFA